jgi:hypothetical protein
MSPGEIASKVLSAVKTMYAMRTMKLFHRTPRAITTDEVRKVQFDHHLQAQATVKRIIPTSVLVESAGIYAAIGQEDTYAIIRSYLNLIALNEAEGTDWNFVVDEAFDDTRLGDADLEAHFIPAVLELQRRAMFEDAPMTPKETEAAFAETLTWKVEQDGVQ